MWLLLLCRIPATGVKLLPSKSFILSRSLPPDTDYVSSFYINPPGTSPETGCIWGTSSEPVGNWAAYTAGANTDSNGDTFVKIGWNPVYMEDDVSFRKTKPDYGIEVECEGGNCNGLPCKIDPAVNDVNEVSGSSSDDVGTGGFCVVTVPKGETARIVIFDGSGGSGDSSSDDDEEESTSTAEPTSTATSTSSSTTTSSTTEPPTSTSTITSSSSSSTTNAATSSSTEMISSSSTQQDPSGSSSSGWPGYTYRPHVFVETGSGAAFASSTSEAAEETPSPTSGAQQNSQNAMMALLAVIAMAAFTF